MQSSPRRFTRWRLLAVIGPGILVAATGVGAGDLATGAFTGSMLGVSIVWAVAVGALLKFVLNEGLARWQLATGDTLLEGAVQKLGRPVRWMFLVYLLAWSFLVGAALVSAVGAVGHAILPLTEAIAGNPFPLPLRAGFHRTLAPQCDKIFYGVLHSLAAVVLVRAGGYRLFEKLMNVCISVMFLVVVGTAAALIVMPAPELPAPAAGDAAPPSVELLSADGLGWTIALMGGVGGTLTILCYGYWIREEGREGAGQLAATRVDLATGYVVTALFGMAMVVIGSEITVEGKGARLIVLLAERLEERLGTVGVFVRWAFLVGAWGAVFSSLLGVWQSVPYLFADFWNLSRARAGDIEKRRVDTESPAYRGYLWGLAVVPILGLIFVNFQTIQKINAIVGALCIPGLAAVLLVLNGRREWVGDLKSSPATTIVLCAALVFFLVAFGLGAYAAIAS